MKSSEPKWSNQQLAIFDWFKNGKGNLVVRARAGVGKTTSVIKAIEYAPEAKILLAAFNKRIQVELAAKLTNPKAEAKTLHSLGYAFIRQSWGSVRLDDQVDWDRAERGCPRNTPKAVVACVKKLASVLKNASPLGSVSDAVELAYTFDCLPPDGFDETYSVTDVASFAVAARNLATIRDSAGRISFDDMVYVPIATNMVRAWYDLVCVDEAQDMNAAQLILAQRACRKGGRIVLVGDDRQAIYGFRGADSGSLDRLKTELNAVELGLTITYRCPKQVVALASQIVPDFQAAPEAPEGVIEDGGFAKMISQAKPLDFVLSRTNAATVDACLALLRAGTPARIEGKDIGQNLLALIKSVGKSFGVSADIATFVEKSSKWGAREAAKVAARGTESAQKAADLILDKIATLQVLTEGLTSVSELEGRISALFSDSDSNPRPAVVVSTVHKSKGLESNNVFILDHTFRFNGGEELNIRYVAITRSKGRLVFINEQ